MRVTSDYCHMNMLSGPFTNQKMMNRCTVNYEKKPLTVPDMFLLNLCVLGFFRFSLQQINSSIQVHSAVVYWIYFIFLPFEHLSRITYECHEIKKTWMDFSNGI